VSRFVSIILGERERAIRLLVLTGWYMDPLAKHNRSWQVSVTQLTIIKRVCVFFGKAGQARTVPDSRQPLNIGGRTCRAG
jgi:hypothetical protein